jgi:hypothetical protein
MVVVAMGKQEVGWSFRLEDGDKREVLARRVGGCWFFMERNGRYDPWRDIEDPCREYWDRLLDGLKRRYQRKGFSDADVREVERMISERFPS